MPFPGIEATLGMDDAGMYGVIHLYRSAPMKPVEGQPCNGCGVCCASEPCPIGVVVSQRRLGPCVALLWREDDSVYRCGVAAEPLAYLPEALKWAAPTVAKLALRYISAGSRCDSNVQAQPETSGI
jgi:hypothetical protein